MRYSDEMENYEHRKPYIHGYGRNSIKYSTQTKKNKK